LISGKLVTIVTRITSELDISRSLKVLISACSELVDEIVVIVPKNEKFLIGMTWSALSEIKCSTKVVTLAGSIKNTHEIFDIPELNDSGIVVWISEDVCYIDADAIVNLATHVAGRKNLSFAFPACVGTERLTYIQQAMGFLPSWCFKMWDGFYIDYLDMRKEHANLQEACHRNWLNALQDGTYRAQRFNIFRMDFKDIPVECAFAFDYKKHKKLFSALDKDIKDTLQKNIQESEICGSAWTAYYAYPEHKSHMDKTDIWNQYLQYAKSQPDTTLKTTESEIENHSESSLINAIVNSCIKQPKLEDIRFCISTHVSDMHRSIPVIVNSLFKNGITAEQIHITAGGFDKKQTLEINNVKVHCVTHNSYDHTALIDVAEQNIPGWWWFVMHATSEAGPKFAQRIIEKGFESEHISVLEAGWLNMGLMSRSFIENNYNYIINLKNCSKMQAILSEQMYWRMAQTRSYYDPITPDIYAGSREVYQDGIQRQVLYLKGCDLYKYQAYHIVQERTQRLLSENFVKSADLIPQEQINKLENETIKK
jgi:hypothetical protein